MIMAATDPRARPAGNLLADPPGDLPRWRDRLECLWRRQVAEIVALSLAYHDAASADRPGDGPELAGTRSGRLQPTLARVASAHHALAEIEAALHRIDTASYGVCEHCGGQLRADWLDARPQLRYCRRCRPPQQHDRNPSGAAARAGHDR